MGSQENKTKSKISLFKSHLGNMADLPKKMIKYATPVSLFLMALGTAFFVANRVSNDYSIQTEFITTTFITNSFFVFAEFLIASFFLDILIRKSNK